MPFRQRRRQPHGAADRPLRPAGQAEMVPHRHLLRIEGQDAPVQSARLVEPPRPVMLHRRGKQILRRHRIRSPSASTSGAI